MDNQSDYDVCLSFAGEDRDCVEAVAETLKGEVSGSSTIDMREPSCGERICTSILTTSTGGWLATASFLSRRHTPKSFGPIMERRSAQARARYRSMATMCCRRV